VRQGSDSEKETLTVQMITAALAASGCVNG
jgi:hypothetical protein